MGFFSSDAPKRITKDEWEEIRRNLYSKLDEREREELKKFFQANLEESGVEQGISRAEYDAGMAWLRANMKDHGFEESDLYSIAHYFEEHLKD